MTTNPQVGKNITMIKQNFSIEIKQLKRLKDHKDESGIPMSVVVRRGIDMYFNKQKEEKDGTDKD